ncbi:MAG: hypothetical protein ACI9LU_000049 [Polaribacter sp.]|jgi:hypothetical protein
MRWNGPLKTRFNRCANALDALLSSGTYQGSRLSRCTSYPCPVRPVRPVRRVLASIEVYLLLRDQLLGILRIYFDKTTVCLNHASNPNYRYIFSQMFATMIGRHRCGENINCGRRVRPRLDSLGFRVGHLSNQSNKADVADGVDFCCQSMDSDSLGVKRARLIFSKNLETN